jgi:hypothetical protein
MKHSKPSQSLFKKGTHSKTHNTQVCVSLIDPKNKNPPLKSGVKLCSKTSKIGFLPNFNISHERIILESEKPQNLSEIFGLSRGLDTKARDNAMAWLAKCQDILEKKSLYVGQCICFFL